MAMYGSQNSTVQVRLKVIMKLCLGVWGDLSIFQTQLVTGCLHLTRPRHAIAPAIHLVQQSKEHSNCVLLINQVTSRFHIVGPCEGGIHSSGDIHLLHHIGLHLIFKTAAML